jgi:hypothetical protein
LQGLCRRIAWGTVTGTARDAHGTVTHGNGGEAVCSLPYRLPPRALTVHGYCAGYLRCRVLYRVVHRGL